jgi:hypothetical protein
MTCDTNQQPQKQRKEKRFFFLGKQKKDAKIFLLFYTGG